MVQESEKKELARSGEEGAPYYVTVLEGDSPGWVTVCASLWLMSERWPGIKESTGASFAMRGIEYVVSAVGDELTNSHKNITPRPGEITMDYLFDVPCDTTNTPKEIANNTLEEMRNAVACGIQKIRKETSREGECGRGLT